MSVVQNNRHAWGKMFLLINCLVIVCLVANLTIKHDDSQEKAGISTTKTTTTNSDDESNNQDRITHHHRLLSSVRPSIPDVQLEEMVFDPKETPEVTKFTSTDGLMVVDLWESSACDTKSNDINELSVKVNDLIKMLRPMGVKIIHNVGESKNTKVQKQYSSMYWTQQDKGTILSGDRSLLIRGRTYLRKRAAFLKNRKKKPDPSPLDLYPQMKPQIYCNGTYNKQKKSKLVNPAVQVDQTADIMFDSGYYFKQLAELGIKRLFYVGASLNICVFHSRQNSAMMAMMSNKFDEVGIVLDLTQPHMRVRSPQPGCENMTQQECAVEFARWIHYRVQPKEAKKQKAMKFWQLSSSVP